jgi:hypothetical protein
MGSMDPLDPQLLRPWQRIRLILESTFGESDLGSALPAFLDFDAEDLVLGLGRAPVGVHHAARDLHLLHATLGRRWWGSTLAISVPATMV